MSDKLELTTDQLQEQITVLVEGKPFSFSEFMEGICLAAFKNGEESSNRDYGEGLRKGYIHGYTEAIRNRGKDN